MIAIEVRTAVSTEEVFESLFRFRGLNIPAAELSEYLATVIFSRIRKRFLKQENPDGTKWPMTRAAQLRLVGKHVSAKGGKYAPGGKKTGGNILFASGNLFHSIKMQARGGSAYAIMSDVPYASYYMNPRHTIIGTTNTELNTVLSAAVKRML